MIFHKNHVEQIFDLESFGMSFLIFDDLCDILHVDDVAQFIVEENVEDFDGNNAFGFISTNKSTVRIRHNDVEELRGCCLSI